ncbi:phosphoenolpyruvate--protein phosphotransferase [Treponema sp. HNW]|uniref:phosphoenolpyruvate--protein phosphotransferase n=1 Tax=Treponema sp. HNW TaxID=3116654 RepID=UPI003D09C13F
MQKTIHGSVLAEGLCMGTVLKLSPLPETDIHQKIGPEDIERECALFSAAQNEVLKKLQYLISNSAEIKDKAQEDILNGYTAILKDPELKTDVTEKIKTEYYALTAALARTSKEYAEDMEGIEDEYLRQRADDFTWIFLMLISAAQAVTGNSDYTSDFAAQNKHSHRNNKNGIPFILTAHNISPVELAETDKELLIGIIVENGSITSHAAIVARSYGIPMLSNISPEEFNENDTLIIDGADVIINPGKKAVQEFEKKRRQAAEEKRGLAGLIDKKAVTTDGKHIELFANIGSDTEVFAAIEQNADGIGLFRTEFLLNKNPNAVPSEERQYEIYSSVLKAMRDKPVTIRTFDIGGDKKYPCIPMPEEENPFLGWRGIRYCVDNTELFFPQLRALLRAAVHGNLYIMFPMITTEEEVGTLLSIIGNIKADFDKEGIAYGKNVKIGIMIETPAAALIADKLVQTVDFFSIGTNDLTQYTLAADRNNSKIAHLYREDHPAILQLIKLTIDAAKKYNKHVCVCGEMAGNPVFTQILLDSGLDCFSMSPERIQKIKSKIIKTIVKDIKHGKIT